MIPSKNLYSHAMLLLLGSEVCYPSVMLMVWCVPLCLDPGAYSQSKKKYCQLDREALALIFGATRFWQYLWGRHSQAVSDHKPLLRLFGHDRAIPDRSSPRIIRWAFMLSACDYTLVYHPGQIIGHADGLSRLPLETNNFHMEQRLGHQPLLCSLKREPHHQAQNGDDEYLQVRI